MLKKLLIISVTTVLLAEFVLNIAGYKPGYWASFGGFQPVDELTEYETYTTDNYGIYKFSYWVYDTLQVNYNWRTLELEGEERFHDRLQRYDQIDYVLTSFGELKTGRDSAQLQWYVKVLKQLMMSKEDWTHAKFVSFFDSIKELNDPDRFAQAIRSYVQKPFNDDGFRGIEMKVHDTTRTRVLLIGDSFVYGMSATPYFNSYADVLLAQGYEVYAAGIPGTDVAQYAAIASKYIPRLSPDAVIINFCEQEDLLRFPRQSKQGRPHEHYTNAGLFSSYPFGKYLSAQDAYNTYDSLCHIPSGPLLNDLLSCTTIGSLIWGKLRQRGCVSHPYFEHYLAVNNVETEQKISNTIPHLRKIDSVCQEQGAQLIHVIIPEREARHNQNSTTLTVDSAVIHKLFDHDFFVPSNLDKYKDLDEGDFHFNNSGSLKFANFIDSLINVNTKNAKGSLRQSSE